MKIKYACNWDSSHAMADRVKRNWGEAPNGWQIVTDDDFDYLVSFNFSQEMFSVPKEKNIVFTMEPNWSLGIKDEVVDNSFKVFSSVDRFAGRPNVEMIPCLMFMEDSGGSTINHRKQAGSGTRTTMQDYLNDNNFKKSKKCSIILAAHRGLNGQYSDPGAMYQHRENLLLEILKSDLDIDIYGRNWDISDPRYKGAAPLKEDALRDYEFSIALENSRENYYLSEKLSDCFLNNCVPIYDGCNYAHKFYNPMSFEKIDMTSPTVIEDIRYIIEGSNEKYINHVIDSKNKYFKDYNIYTYLRKCLT